MNVASQWTGKAECSEKALRRKAWVLLLPEKFIRVFRNVGTGYNTQLRGRTRMLIS